MGEVKLSIVANPPTAPTPDTGLLLFELDEYCGSYEWVAAYTGDDARRMIADRYREAGCDEMGPDDWRCVQLEPSEVRARHPGLLALFEAATEPTILEWSGPPGYV